MTIDDAATGARADHVVGRSAELHRIDELVGTIADGGAPVLVIAGPALVGVTALLDACVRSARGQGVAVLRASGAEAERTLDLATLQELLLQALSDPGSDSDAGPESDPGSELKVSTLRVALGLADGPRVDETAIVTATRVLLNGLAESGGLVVVVDDHHLADPMSRRIIAAMAGLPRLGIVLGTHDTAAPDLPARQLITISRLDDECAAELLMSRHPDITDRVRSATIAWAQGNPLALIETAATLTPGQRAGAAPLPRVIPVSRRLGELANTGTPDDDHHTRLINFLHSLTQPESEAARFSPRLHVLTDSLAWAACDMDTRNALLRIAAAGIDPNALTHLRDRLSALRCTVECFGTSSAMRAEQVLVMSLLAEADFATGGWEAGVALLREAITLANGSADRAQLIGRAAAVASATDVPLATELVEQLRLDDPHFSRSLLTATAAAGVLAHGPRGDIDAAYRILSTALDRQPAQHFPEDPTAGPVVTDALRGLRWICWLGRRPDAWAYYHATMERLSPQARHPLDDALADGRIDTTRIDELITRLADPSVQPIEVILIGETASAVDRLSECRVALESVATFATNADIPIITMWADLQLSLDDLTQGHYDAVIATHGGSHRDVETLATAPNMLGWAADYHLGIAHARRGDLEMAVTIAESIAAWALPRRARMVMCCAEHLLAICANAQSDHESAYTHLTAITTPGVSLEPSWWATAVDFELVHAAIRTGRQDVAGAHVRAMAAAGYPDRSPVARMLYLTACALLETGETARALFAAALSVPETERWAFDRARVQVLAGAQLRRTHAPTRSRPLLTDAVDTFTALRATPWIAWARSELEATASTRRRRPASANGAAPDRSPELLTPRERHIAGLAAEGLSNKDIATRLVMSPRTVGNHLHRVYAKLSVTSRLGLRDALVDCPPDT
ncbi:LuxR C-terminal-related transcriptional regulator [Gordonia sp. ABSL1-1]|uniref:helix-turn-helix transcriptional regulator n=1 Tax=Gordonia sp. ABSL1-1 TaxID=3053923 RepID=UPI0025747EB3|nr:LuxR family transcriptional regulator [Gordonia sp. ABSL1-1]MDL9938155.1 LuxR C-terminal-related transcriptional regulator [Gordonia sp. ABSL1-1]